jgi:hypothetical protein
MTTRKQKQLARARMRETGEKYTEALRWVLAQEPKPDGPTPRARAENILFLSEVMRDWSRADTRWIFRGYADPQIRLLCDRSFSTLSDSELASFVEHINGAGMQEPSFFRCYTARTLVDHFDAWLDVLQRPDESEWVWGNAWLTCEALADLGLGTMYARYRGDRFELCVENFEPRGVLVDSVALYERAGMDVLIEHVAKRINAKMIELSEVGPTISAHLRLHGWLDARLVPGSHYHSCTEDPLRSFVRFFPRELHQRATTLANTDPWADIKKEARLGRPLAPAEFLAQLDECVIRPRGE